MGKLVNLSMFRGYVNKVLPTVYDDSLSYYEVLAKVMEKINEIINLDNAQNEIINNIPEDVSEFAEDLAQFKSSMTQQFNDFKTEINADFDAFEDEVNAKIAADTTPTQGSTKLITSGGVYASLQDIINSLVKDARPTEDSTNYVTSGGVWKAINDAVEALEATLATKQNALTWDTTPTANSTNPVQSGGIKTYVDNAAQGVQDNLDTYITNNNSRVSGIEGDITDLETGKQDALTFDLAPTLGSNNPVTSNGIAQALAGVTPSIEVDPVPTQGSTNPVSSNGVYVAVSDLETELEEGLADKQDTLTWDTTPTKNSQNPVTSGGLFEKFAQIDPYGTVDPEPEQGSPNAVSSGGTWTALQTLNNDLTAAIDTKQDILTFDSVPTEDSENPVYSGGVFAELEGKQDILTFDAVPTEDSENPVYSGGVFAELALKADKSETAEYPIGGNVSGAEVSVTNSADAYVQGLTVYGRSTNKNLFDKSKVVDRDKKLSYSNGNVYQNSTTVGTSVSPYIGVVSGATYTISGSAGGICHQYTENQESVGPGSYYGEGITTVINPNAKYLRFDYPTADEDNMQLELGSTATPYEPYGIISIGDSGSLTIATTNSDSSESSTATLTTGLPYCGIPVTTGETYTDEQGQKWLADTASVAGKVTRCPKIALSTLTWTYDSTNGVWTAPDLASTALYSATAPLLICVEYTVQPYVSLSEGGISWDSSGNLVVKTTDSTNSPTGDIVYALATPTTQELTAEEQRALVALRTFNSTTNIAITDSPYVDLDYLKNTANGEAIAQLEDKINVEISSKQNTLTFDTTPADSSTNPVTSRGIYTALAVKQNTLTWDNAPTQDSTNAISSGAVYDALQNAGGIQRTLIYDDNLQKDPTQNVIFTQNASNFDEIEIEYWEYQDEGDHGVLPFSTKISKYYLSTAPTVYVGEYNAIVTLVGTAGHYSTYDVSSTGLTYNTANTGNTKVVPIHVYGINY